MQRQTSHSELEDIASSNFSKSSKSINIAVPCCFPVGDTDDDEYYKPNRQGFIYV